MALARSLNIPAVRMLHSYGVGRFYSLLNRLGISTLHRNANDYGLSLILGGAEGTLWDLTGIYAGMARSVSRHFMLDTKDTCVFFGARFDTLSGILTDARTNGFVPQGSLSNDEPLDAAACWLTLKAMLEVKRPDDEGAWREFTSSRKVAWKTATSQGFRDAWAIGVTPSHAIGVWVGNADGEGRPGLTGLSAAAPIMFDLFGLLPPSDWFECPESRLVQISVCAKSGCRAGPNCASTTATLIPPAGLHNASCPYCRLVHCDSTLNWRVSTNCVRLTEIRSEPWFVLPPAMEWYFRESHADYEPLPPFRPDCIASGSDDRSGPMAVVYPGWKGEIYVPAELDGVRGRTVFEAAHREPRTTIYWHLDGDYLGSTADIHQMSLAPKPGEHRLVLVDEDGARSERLFTVLLKD
jgi:penicillin-binding protein 1C